MTVPKNPKNPSPGLTESEGSSEQTNFPTLSGFHYHFVTDPVVGRGRSSQVEGMEVVRKRPKFLHIKLPPADLEHYLISQKGTFRACPYRRETVGEFATVPPQDEGAHYRLLVDRWYESSQTHDWGNSSSLKVLDEHFLDDVISFFEGSGPTRFLVGEDFVTLFEGHPDVKVCENGLCQVREIPLTPVRGLGPYFLAVMDSQVTGTVYRMQDQMCVVLFNPQYSAVLVKRNT